tara:strand:+ start:5996 stop:7423 length:1428 start_codon:yes stop_codon:yes gene_type:complete
MSRNSPAIEVREVELFERPVTLRLPFKFGAVTLRETPQLFVRARIICGTGEEIGVSAELLAPKWFDKNPDLSNEDNFEQLRSSMRIAAKLYQEAGRFSSAFALHAGLQAAHYAACTRNNLNGLIASYGTALMDRAVLDALCRSQGQSIFQAIHSNLPGIDAATTPDLYGTDIAAHLRAMPAPERIDVRHTVGMADAITEADLTSRVDDGLPESLEAVIARYGHRYFKLKVGGDTSADIKRLGQIAELLDRGPADYCVSLDGNEQFADAAAVVDWIDAVESVPSLARLWASTLYLEQPIARAQALEQPVHTIAARKPVAIDESDSHIGVFPVARALGYHGISSKSCKGFYRAILNVVRAREWNTAASGNEYFIIAEDLTTQPGISVQQDFALAALTGASHVERNGHHYVHGFGDAPLAEQQRFAGAHGDLYTTSADGKVRLKIEDGSISLKSLQAPGLAVAAYPDWDSLSTVSKAI